MEEEIGSRPGCDMGRDLWRQEGIEVVDSYQPCLFRPGGPCFDV